MLWRLVYSFFFSALSFFYNCLFGSLDLLILAELTICKASANVLHFLDSPIIFTIILLVVWKLMYYRIKCMNIFRWIYSHCCACHSVETSGLNFILYGVYELRLQILFFMYSTWMLYMLLVRLCAFVLLLLEVLRVPAVSRLHSHMHTNTKSCAIGCFENAFFNRKYCMTNWQQINWFPIYLIIYLNVIGQCRSFFSNNSVFLNRNQW